MPDTAERLRKTTSTLPEALLSEVLDFAEFLSAKQARLDAQPADVSLGALCGGLADSAAFSDSPIRVQERLRDEWR
jgi:hypothetical protein